jgi:hypothetical protein
MESDEIPSGYNEEDLNRIKKEVLDVLQSGQVIAVAGPNGIATAKPIADFVHKFNSNVPIITESPVSRRKLGNPTDKAFGALVEGKPIYRISSGLDERVPHIAALTKILLAKNLRVTLLLEDTPYSLEIKDRVIAHLKTQTAIQREPNVIRIAKDALPSEASKAFDADFVFYLGTGGRYSELAKTHLQSNRPVLFAGLMNAWAYASLDKSIYSLLIDLEDIGTHEEGKPYSHEQRDFVTRFSAIGPDTRDQAFSYDAGICIKNAWQDAQKNRLSDGRGYDACLRAMQQGLERTAGHDGVTGHITFPEGGGQNAGLVTSFVLHTPRLRETGEISWSRLSETEIVSMCLRLKQSTQ